MRLRKEEPEAEVDPTAWLIDSGFAEFLLLHTYEIKYMAMFGYTFLHGYKLFGTFSPTCSTSFKFISMLFQCTGGGILVPIFINSIPVPLAQDAYPVAILVSFLIHNYFPVLREVMSLSPVFKTAITILYETLRASVVVKMTAAAGNAIAPSDFSIAVFGPIFCGTIAGCGGAFLPLNKGLDPIKNGLGPPMLSAAIAATFYHLFMSTSLSAGIIDADKKAQVLIAIFFIAYNLSTAFPTLKTPPADSSATEEPEKNSSPKQSKKKKR